MSLPQDASIDINEQNMRSVPQGDDRYNSDVPTFNNERQAGNAMRDDIAMRMWEDYITRRTSQR
jgi:hypothetical protein